MAMAVIVSIPVSTKAQPLPLPGLTGSESFLTQDVINAVTQGFHFDDERFFDEGRQQFEHDIEALQDDSSIEPILTVEPIPDSWQQSSFAPRTEPLE